ncbi:DinB family protein [Roseivirga echinicomitans]
MKHNLRETILSAFERFIMMPENEANLRLSAGKWSIQEILGHMIDSAANNHARIVKAQSTDDLVFEGYDQEAWVENQNYAGAQWHDLIILWRQYNLHIDYIVSQISDKDLTKERVNHNLDKIAWTPVPADQPTTLEYFINDYIKHLKHHLGQIEEIISAN